MTSVEIINTYNDEKEYIGNWPYPIDFEGFLELFGERYKIIGRTLNPYEDRLTLIVRPLNRETITIDGFTLYLDALTEEERKALMNSRNMTW